VSLFTFALAESNDKVFEDCSETITESALFSCEGTAFLHDTLQSVNTKSEENVSKQNGETVDGEKLPSTLECEFTDKVQKVVVRIANYKKDQLKANIIPENNNMNIRFNQIKTPDGKYDGPFGREISYKISGKGEVWLIIGKNLMAEGDNVGRFSVRIE